MMNQDFHRLLEQAMRGDLEAVNLFIPQALRRGRYDLIELVSSRVNQSTPKFLRACKLAVEAKETDNWELLNYAVSYFYSLPSTDPHYKSSIPLMLLNAYSFESEVTAPIWKQAQDFANELD